MFQKEVTPEFKEKLVYDILYVAFYTRLLLYVPKSTIMGPSLKYLFFMGMAEFSTIFTQLIVICTNKVNDEKFLNGDIVWGFVIANCIIHIRLGY